MKIENLDFCFKDTWSKWVSLPNPHQIQESDIDSLGPEIEAWTDDFLELLDGVSTTDRKYMGYFLAPTETSHFVKILNARHKPKADQGGNCAERRVECITQNLAAGDETGWVEEFGWG
jgi:hypothetical protein